jgi:hypothetical protein
MSNAAFFNLIFDVLMVVKMAVFVVWVIPPCGLVARYQCFGGTYFFHLQLRRSTLAACLQF